MRAAMALISSIALAACDGGPQPPPPLLLGSVNPDRGSVLGGTRVVVSGDGFQEGTIVTFAGRWATGVSVTSPSSLTCTTPDGLPGLVDVAIVRPDGTRSSAPIFVYDAPPTAIAPGDLIAALGSRVTLDASLSTDPEALALRASWELQTPAGSVAALDDPTSTAPSFVPDVAGDYTAHLWVTDLAGARVGPAVVHVSTSSTGSHVPDTGPAQCYASSWLRVPCPRIGAAGFGQDATYVINPPSLTVGAASVVDEVTGLTWQRAVEGTFNWFEATGTPDPRYNPVPIDACGGLVLGGFDDWRLPTVQELATLIRDDGHGGPATDLAAFPGTAGAFWSATADLRPGGMTYQIDFGWGGLGRGSPRSDLLNVRCVRGSRWGSGGLVDGGDGTSADPGTGLSWERNPELTYRDWNDAVAHCQGLVLGGHDDWRLPSYADAVTLLGPLGCRDAFPDVVDASYWTSTGSWDAARTLECASAGWTGGQLKRTYQLARCVR